MKALTTLPAAVTDVATSGSWWCRRCRAFVGLDVSGNQSVCVLCRSVHVKWCKPVCNQADPTGRAVRPSDAPVDVERAHGLFQLMRAKL